jgi:hypothetical protein
MIARVGAAVRSRQITVLIILHMCMIHWMRHSEALGAWKDCSNAEQQSAEDVQCSDPRHMTLCMRGPSKHDEVAQLGG